MTASFRISEGSSREDLLTKIDGQKRQIAKQEAKIDRQRDQIAALSERATERNRTIAAQDRVIAEQGDEIQALKEQITRLQETQKESTR